VKQKLHCESKTEMEIIDNDWGGVRIRAAMSPTQVLLLAFLIGFFAGLRSLTAPADCLGRVFGLAEGAESSFVDWHGAGGCSVHAVGVGGARHR
jgi:hypothetical protein